jgi:hypothetical protein
LTVLQQNKHNHKESCVLNLSFIQNNFYSHLKNTECDIEINGGLVSGWHLFYIYLLLYIDYHVFIQRSEISIELLPARLIMRSRKENKR